MRIPYIDKFKYKSASIEYQIFPIVQAVHYERKVHAMMYAFMF